jgi:hypothetical protein
VAALLGAADWIILAFIDAQSEPTASVIRQFLVEQPPGLAGKKIIALAFGVPHALSKEEISRLTAYYCFYGYTAPFIETAAQVLFGDRPAHSASPLSIPAIGYDLTRQTEPDPTQLIQILVEVAPDPQATAQPVVFKKGDTLKLRTAVILDRNGNPVPDGTKVTFTRIFSETTELPPQTVDTTDGIARVDFVLDKIGPLRIRAYSEPALTSYEFQITIRETQVTFQTVIPPTLTPTPIPPTRTPTPRPTATPTRTPTPVPPWWQPLATPDAPRRVTLNDWLLALVGISIVSLGAYRIMFNIVRALDRTERTIAATRWGLTCSGAGLVGYILYSMGAPVLINLDELGSAPAAFISSAAFAALPLLAALGQRQLERFR